MQTQLGMAGVLELTMKIIHSLLLVAGAMIDLKRSLVRSVLADQSKESQVNGESPATLVHRACPAKRLSAVPDDSQKYLFPNGVDIFVHPHIFQNAIRTAIEKSQLVDRLS